MRYLPLVLVIAVLLGFVALMAGSGEARARSLRNMGLTLIALVAMALLFGLVVKGFLDT